MLAAPGFSAPASKLCSRSCCRPPVSLCFPDPDVENDGFFVEPGFLGGVGCFFCGAGATRCFLLADPLVSTSPFSGPVSRTTLRLSVLFDSMSSTISTSDFRSGSASVLGVQNGSICPSVLSGKSEVFTGAVACCEAATSPSLPLGVAAIRFDLPYHVPIWCRMSGGNSSSLQFVQQEVRVTCFCGVRHLGHSRPNCG